MTLRWSVTIPAMALVLASAVADADVARAVPDPRQDARATHIVMGLVKEVYTSKPEVLPAGMGERTAYLIEIEVGKVEKGEGLKVDEVVYARGWRSGPHLAGSKEPGGQTLIPRRHMNIRAYMTRDRDGAYDLVAPDGIEDFTQTKN